MYTTPCSICDCHVTNVRWVIDTQPYVKQIKTRFLTQAGAYMSHPRPLLHRIQPPEKSVPENRAACFFECTSLTVLTISLQPLYKLNYKIERICYLSFALFAQNSAAVIMSPTTRSLYSWWRSGLFCNSHDNAFDSQILLTDLQKLHAACVMQSMYTE